MRFSSAEKYFAPLLQRKNRHASFLLRKPIQGFDPGFRSREFLFRSPLKGNSAIAISPISPQVREDAKQSVEGRDGAARIRGGAFVRAAVTPN